jgi:hypothetical protein
MLMYHTTGENRGDCCYGNQYSNGISCVTCEAGTDCSTIGTSLATQSLLTGYWRASTISTDVRPCWFAHACAGNSNTTAARTDTSRECTTITASNDVPSNIPISDGVGCKDTTATSTNMIASITQVDDTTYCAQGYKGPCKCTTYYTV